MTWSNFLNIIFPPRCHLCKQPVSGDDDLHLCPDCTGGIALIQTPLCPICGIPHATDGGSDHLCGSCTLHNPPFSWARAAAVYEGKVQELIHRFKYSNHVQLRRPISLLVARQLFPFIVHYSYDLLIPVPLHRKRLKERGFNQALLIGELLAKAWNLPVARHNLRRIRWTEPQISLGAGERAANVRGAFAVHDPSTIAGKNILLVDDVYTTGSTVSECTKALKQAGAQSVVVITAARAVI